MKERTRKIFIMIVMAALIVSLMAASFAALTYGRYSGGRFDENSPYEDYIDFVGATAYEVSSPEELVNAINNGYSYIKIAADAEEPFVVNSDIADVEVNLVLDVNGHVVVRNSRNPLINVQKSVSVVLVYDSSTTAKGGFYNPVGSALQTSGGTLTVGAGVYESGPNVEAVKSVTTAEISDVFDRVGDRASATAYYKKADSVVLLPKLGEDVYLGETYSGTKNDYLKPDTYLIYTKENNCYVKDGQLLVNCTKTGTEISGTSFRVESNVASCDFYYYYPVGTANEDGFQTYAVVYGYNDVNALASNENYAAENLQKSGLVWPYAAIRSEAGNTFARGGVFQTHFGEKNTYCIYSAGGTMTVGTDSANSAPSFTATGAGVCVRMSGDKNNTLTISSGSFSSAIGDTIKMSGGAMTVTAGSFTKSGGKGIAGGDNAQITNQTAIIDIQGGTLTINGAAASSVTLTAGSADTNNGGTLENVFGILARGGEVSVGGCTLNIYGDYSAGVLSYDGTINLNDKTSITVKQSDAKTDANNIPLTSAGVSSEQGEVGDNPVNLTGNVSITSNGLGITARGTVNVTGGTSTVTTSRGTGIYVNNGSFTVDSKAAITVNSTVQSGYSWATPPGTGPINAPNIYNGVYVQGGSLISNGTLNVTFKGVENDNIEYDFLETGLDNLEVGIHEGWEYYDKAGRVLSANSDIYQNFQTKSYAVRVEGNDSTIVAIASGEVENSIGGGVLVNGGKVYLGATITLDESGKVQSVSEKTNNPVSVITTGNTAMEGRYVTRRYTERNWGGITYCVEISSYIGISGAADNWAYCLTSTGGDAVKVDGGSLTVLGGSYQAAQGNGILVSGATTTTKGEYAVNISGGTFIGNDRYNNIEGNAMPGAAASYGLKMYGGSLQVIGGTFGSTTSSGSGAFVMGERNNAVTSHATASILAGNFQVGGTAGLSVYYGADVYIGGDATGESGTETPTFQAGSAGMTVETYASGMGDSRITVYRGSFTGSQDGIWYGGALTYLTIYRDNVTLTGPRDPVHVAVSPDRITYIPEI